MIGAATGAASTFRRTAPLWAAGGTNELPVTAPPLAGRAFDFDESLVLAQVVPNRVAPAWKERKRKFEEIKNTQGIHE